MPSAPNIYTRLIKDHDKQRELCEALSATNGATQLRTDLWTELKTELEAHAAAEEQVFYSALMKIPEGTDEARHSVHEHQEMTKLIKELDEGDQGSGGWMNKFKVLKHQVIHHLDAEEQEIFPKAKSLISSYVAQDMTLAFNTRKSAEVRG